MVMPIAILQKVRDARKSAIKLNPDTIIVSVPVYTDNGYGKMIQTSSTSATVSGVRISHYSSGINETAEGLTPDTIADVMYLISDWQTEISEGWKFIYNGRQYKTRTPETQIMYGGIIGYRARLDDITAE